MNKWFKSMHFVQDTADLALLQKLTQKWRNLVNKFKQEVEQNEESVKKTLQSIKDGLVKWQHFFRNDRWVSKKLVFLVILHHV